MSTVSKPYISPEQYLAMERAAPFRSEYYRGEMFAMAGANRVHNTICSNVIIAVGSQLRGRNCQIFTSDMRVHIPAKGLYTYPDASALCGQPEFVDSTTDILLNPALIMEVLSESTEDYDRGTKFEFYQALPSVREYVLISQDKTLIERYMRQPSGEWLYTSVSQPEQSLRLDSIDCELVLAEVYDKLDLHGR